MSNTSDVETETQCPGQSNIVMAIIGPILPLRGGIAHLTTLMHRDLGQKCRLHTVSFCRQYPKLIFPGASNYETGMEDHKEEGVDYRIDSMNPLTWERVVRQLLSAGVQVAVIPWWTFFWMPCYWYIARRLRGRGVKIVFHCHNVVDHEAMFWKRWASLAVLRLGDLVLIHSEKEKERLLGMLPGIQTLVRSIPIYSNFPGVSVSWPRRADLELLFYGFVRPYKGLEVLLEALALIKGNSLKLTISGEFWTDPQQTKDKIAALGLEEMVELLPRYATADETASMFNRADYVVLPYRSATGSGVIPLAYYYGKPVVATKVGGLPEAVDDGVTGHLLEPESPRVLADLISQLSHHKSQAMAPAIEAKKEELSVPYFCDSLLESISQNVLRRVTN